MVFCPPTSLFGAEMKCTRFVPRLLSYAIWPLSFCPLTFRPSSLVKKKKKLFGHYYTLSMELYSDRWKQLYMARMDDVTDPEMIIHYRIGKTEEIVYSSVFRKSDFSFVQPDLWLVNRV